MRAEGDGSLERSRGRGDDARGLTIVNSMNYYISTDIEGLSGYGHANLSDDQILLAHIAAVADGLASGGAGETSLTSFHGIPRGLPAHVRPVQRSDPREFDLPQLTSQHAGLVLLGFHGLFPGSWGHSYKYQYLWLNGQKCGEHTIQILLAASRGVPTVMFAGDDRSIPEAQRLIPGLATVCTRPGQQGDEGPISQAVLDKLRAMAAKVVGERFAVPEIPRALTLGVPFRTDLAAQYASGLPYPTIRDGRIVSRKADNFADTYAFLMDCFDCTTRARAVHGPEPWD
jgi:D-amino peptidase